MKRTLMVFFLPFLLIVVHVSFLSSCRLSGSNIEELWTQRAQGTPIVNRGTPIPYEPKDIHQASIPLQPSALPGGSVAGSPTPDPPHSLPGLRREPIHITVKQGETLHQIAMQNQVPVQQILQANKLTNGDLLSPGQILEIPAPNPQGDPADFKIIPDSELIYGPYAATFDIQTFVQSKDGFLAHYRELVEEQDLDGAQILARVARQTSVNPRLLLAVLEYQSGWVTSNALKVPVQEFPIGLANPRIMGLYNQLGFAAGELNRGYSLWKLGATNLWVLNDGSAIPVSPLINAGTAGIQHLFAGLYDRQNWQKAVSAKGLYATYEALFGSPFVWTFDPILPIGLAQPEFQLPFENGKIWVFTGGPHSAWGSGSGWAALDFAPLMQDMGCLPSDEWVTAVADGTVVFSDAGEVIQDLDDDGYWQSGWSILYMHIENRDRVSMGSRLKAGMRIGHPSCEGGVSTGTHLHLARRYNGEWISADGELPFNLDGWTSGGTGEEYEGILYKDSKSIQAYAGHAKDNEIQR